MNYFAAIKKRADELNDAGQAYLDTLPFMNNDSVLRELHRIAWSGRYPEDSACNPDWVDMIQDGWIPFGPSRCGSVYQTLGTAIVAKDALLRNLLEVAEGRGQPLDLCCLAERNVVDQYTKADEESTWTTQNGSVSR